MRILFQAPSTDVSRRTLLAVGAVFARPLFGAGRGTRIPSPEIELEDSLTGRKMSRLTNNEVLSHLPAYYNRALSKRGNFLLIASEVSGSRQIHRCDLGRDRLTQLTVGPDVHPYSPTLAPRDRTFFYLQGDEVREASARAGADRKLYQCEEGWTLTGDLGLSTDGRYAAVIEMAAGDRVDDIEAQFEKRPNCRLRVVETERVGSSWVAVEEQHWLSHPRFRPGRSDILYDHEGPWGKVDGRLRLTSLRGESKKELTPRTGDEQVGHGYWGADGREVFYVSFPNESLRGATIQAVLPESGESRTVSPCSAFGWMTGNQDGSTIVGASKRPSGPNIYVLFVKLQREITLSEHGSSGKAYPIAGTDRMDPYAANPVPIFSENSQWVYFTSDREGMPAVYRMKLEDLVEQT